MAEEETDVTEETPVEETPEEPTAEAESADEAPAAEVADEGAADEAEPAEGEETADAEAVPAKKAKKQRPPRSQRRQRPKRKRAKPAERKPIVRLPKPESERGRRQERQGRVVSAAMEKTIVVEVDMLKAHRMYKKVLKRSTKFHAHDEANTAKVGDVVRIVETRPLSKQKRWRLVEVLEEAK